MAKLILNNIITVTHEIDENAMVCCSLRPLLLPTAVVSYSFSSWGYLMSVPGGGTGEAASAVSLGGGGEAAAPAGTVSCC